MECSVVCRGGEWGGDREWGFGWAHCDLPLDVPFCVW